ncbi:MAG TPA: DUF1236 domain-containing protein [Alphaproteobacteria bacterium]|jgi:hypothetical protein|nr:DUF1236 domain-containing protein [Alphaproteobacteria bacterium]
MKRTLTAPALALTLFAGAAMAQTVSTTTTTRTVELSPEQRTVVRQYVVKDTHPSIAVQGFEVRAGAVLPPNVAFYEVPNVQRYRYSYINNHRVLVDPSTRTVVEVIE